MNIKNPPKRSLDGAPSGAEMLTHNVVDQPLLGIGLHQPEQVSRLRVVVGQFLKFRSNSWQPRKHVKAFSRCRVRGENSLRQHGALPPCWGPFGFAQGRLFDCRTTSLWEVVPSPRMTGETSFSSLKLSSSPRLRQGRSDQGSLPCSTQPRSASQTPASSRQTHRLPRLPGAGSSNRRGDRHAWRST